MQIRTTAIAVALFLTMGVIGCGSTQLDRNWGRSYEAARSAQTLNPNAGQDTTPVEGLEGPAAQRVHEQYLKGSQKEKKSAPEFGVLTINK